MSRLVVSEFVTLDGVMEDPGGAEGSDRGGWAFQFERGPEGDKFKLDEVLPMRSCWAARRTRASHKRGHRELTRPGLPTK